MKEIKLKGKWHIKAPINEVFSMMTDFENFPIYFPKVAASIHIAKRDGNHLEMDAVAKSFGQDFPVKMKTEILPERGFISDNNSPKFGTSGHEEFLLSEDKDGTTIDYTYEVTIHKAWLRVVAKPLIGWFSMMFWKKAVIDVLKEKLEK